MLPPPIAGPPSAEGPGSEGVLAAGPPGTCEQKHRDVMAQASPHSGERPPAREAETTLCRPGGRPRVPPSRGGRRQVDLSQNGYGSLSLYQVGSPGLSPFFSRAGVSSPKHQGQAHLRLRSLSLAHSLADLLASTRCFRRCPSGGRERESLSLLSLDPSGNCDVSGGSWTYTQLRLAADVPSRLSARQHGTQALCTPNGAERKEASS